MSHSIFKLEFERFLQSRHGQEPEWMHQLRKTALQRLQDTSFPTKKHEDWKYTSIQPFLEHPFSLDTSAANNAIANSLKSTLGPIFSPHRLVFVDGIFHPTLSSTTELPEKADVRSLASALLKPTSTLKDALQRQLDRENRAFSMLNLAFCGDGAYIHLPRGLALEKPIHIVNVSTEGPATSQQPRHVIVAEENSQATILETYQSASNSASYWTNTATEFEIGANAKIVHYKVQNENKATLHLASTHAHLMRDSHFENHLVSFGGKIVRNDTQAVTSAENCECTLNGLYLSTQDQHVDNRTFLDHAKPHCNSFQVYKGILDGTGTGVFNGKILVRQDAQKTDAKQSNQALLLSDQSTIHSKPQLEIFADDVKCTHGATSGNLDPDALFFLRSRGIEKEAARGLLTFAFVNELLNHIDHDLLRQTLETQLSSILQARTKK